MGCSHRRCAALPPNLRDAFCIFWDGTGSTSVRRMQGGAPSPITIDPDYPPAARVEIAMINRNLTIAASILFAVHYACGPAKAASESERLAAQLEQISAPPKLRMMTGAFSNNSLARSAGLL